MTKELSAKGLEALARIRKDDPRAFGTAAELEAARPPERAISTGLAGLDRIIGRYGGYPRGRFIQIYGENSAGKSTLAAHAVAQAQRDGTRALWVDFEHTYENEYAEAIGIDNSKVDLAQPLTAEKGVDMMQEICFTSDWGLIVADSVGAMNPAKIYEREIGQPLPAARARLVAEMFSRLTALAARNNVAILLINHLTANMETDARGVPVLIPAGGRKMGYGPSLNINVFRRAKPLNEQGRPVEGDQEAAGSNVIIRIDKNKIGRAHRKVEVVHQFMRGFDVMTDLVRTALDLGVVTKAGTWLSFGELKCNGELALISSLRSNFDVAPRLYRATRAAILEEAEHERRGALEAGEATRSLLGIEE